MHIVSDLYANFFTLGDKKMSKSIRRMITLLLTLAVLFSLAAPAFAAGEEETAATAVETKAEEATAEKESEKTAAETKAEEAGEQPAAKEPETKQEEAKPAETKKPEASIAKIEISKAVEPKSGDITTKDEKKTEDAAIKEIFVSENGSDENDGSRNAPFATLAKAAKSANAAAETDVKVILLSDLKADETARFYGKNVTIASDGDKAFTVMRKEGFKAAEDEVRGKYNPAMIEVGTLEEKKPEEAKATKLALTNVILDDAGRTISDDYTAQVLYPENKEQNLTKAQDAVVAVYGEAELTLKKDTQILNFGGRAAVYAAGSKAKVALEDNSVIKDTVTEPVLKVLPAIVAENDAAVSKTEFAVVNERTATETPAEENIGLAAEEKIEEAAPTEGTEQEETPDAEKPGEAATDEEENSEEKELEDQLYEAAVPMLAAGDTVTLSFDGNSGSGAPASMEATAGENGIASFTIPSDSPTRGGYTFQGWAKTADATEAAYKKGDTFETEENATLYAVWKQTDLNELIDYISTWTGLDFTSVEAEALKALLSSFGINDMADLLVAVFDNPVVPGILDILGGGDDSGATPTIKFESDPKTLVENEDAENYPVTYRTTIDISALIPSILKYFTAEEAELTVTIGMDSRLTPGSDVTVESGALTGAAVVDGNTITVTLTGENIEGSALATPVVFTCTGTLPADAFVPNDKLTTTAELTGASVTISGTPYTTEKVGGTLTAETYMASEELVYDANGGEGGPGTVPVPVTDAYTLDDEPLPTHADKDGSPVVFIGWTAEPDPKIYKRTDNKPDTITTTKIEEGEGDNNFVYAVYGTDDFSPTGMTSDGIADVLQDILVLTYDANGGTGAPGAEAKQATVIAGIKNAKFTIPSKEPTRKYYKFKGWAEEKNATAAKYKYNKGDGLDGDLTIHKDTTLYAVWEQNPKYSLYFNANGGTGAPSTQSGISDENGAVSLTIPSTRPKRTGYTFLGWGTSRVGSAAFQPGDKVTIKNGDVTLYAVWQRGSSSSSSSTGGRVKTGDEANLRLYTAAAMTALWGMLGIVYVLTRKPKKEEGKK